MSHNIMIYKKILFAILSILIIYFKPYFVLFILSLFLLEYVYFLNFIVDIYKHKNGYYSIELNNQDLSEDNFIVIWMYICKLNAFSKLYFLLSKKKINFYNLLLSFIIVLLNIPFKFLKIIYYFMVINDGDMREGLEVFYYNLYRQLKNFKIEILNNKIYLNCYSLGKLIKILMPKNGTDKQKMFNTLVELKRASVNFKEYEDNEEKLVKMPLTRSFNDKGKLIYDSHYAHLVGLSSMHSTSNIPKSLLDYQKVDSPLPTLTKKDAKNPGTIITEKVGSFQQSHKGVWVQKYEIMSVKMNHKEIFEIGQNEYDYITKKNSVYSDIITSNLGEKPHSSVVTELRTNCYSQILINSTNDDFESEIRDITD